MVKITFQIALFKVKTSIFRTLIFSIDSGVKNSKIFLANGELHCASTWKNWKLFNLNSLRKNKKIHNTIFTSHLERMSNYVPLPNNAGLVRRSRLCSSWAVNLGYWRKWHQLGKSCLAKNKYIISSKISVKTIFNPQRRWFDGKK